MNSVSHGVIARVSISFLGKSCLHVTVGDIDAISSIQTVVTYLYLLSLIFCIMFCRPYGCHEKWWKLYCCRYVYSSLLFSVSMMRIVHTSRDAFASMNPRLPSLFWYVVSARNRPKGKPRTESWIYEETLGILALGNPPLMLENFVLIPYLI